MSKNLPRWNGRTTRPTGNGARVWLAAIACDCAEPADAPTVRDDLMRTWLPDRDAGYRSPDGRRCFTWGELRARFDLVEVHPVAP